MRSSKSTREGYDTPRSSAGRLLGRGLVPISLLLPGRSDSARQALGSRRVSRRPRRTRHRLRTDSPPDRPSVRERIRVEHMPCRSSAVDKPVPRYRFAAQPIVAMERDSSGGGYAFSVFVRLNRSLPRDRFGAPHGELRVADASGPAPISTIDPSFTKSRVLRHRVGVRDHPAAFARLHHPVLVSKGPQFGRKWLGQRRVDCGYSDGGKLRGELRGQHPQRHRAPPG